MIEPLKENTVRNLFQRKKAKAQRRKEVFEGFYSFFFFAPLRLCFFALKPTSHRSLHA
jgi:hypothetical protein